MDNRNTLTDRYLTRDRQREQLKQSTILRIKKIKISEILCEKWMLASLVEERSLNSGSLFVEQY